MKPKKPLSLFKHQTPIHIRFSDIDAYGHVNNARFLSYLEEARISYYKKVFSWKPSKQGVILAHTCIDYLIPVYLEDSLKILTRIAKLGNKSYTMEYVFLKNDKEIAAQARAVVVSFDFEKNQSVPWAKEIREKIIAFEGNDVEIKR